MGKNPFKWSIVAVLHLDLIISFISELILGFHVIQTHSNWFLLKKYFFRKISKITFYLIWISELNWFIYEKKKKHPWKTLSFFLSKRVQRKKLFFRMIISFNRAKTHRAISIGNVKKAIAFNYIQIGYKIFIQFLFI